MVGHGAVVTIFGLLAGFGLVMSLIGGFEVFPGTVLAFEIPGDPGAWARAHAGGLMNGMLVFVGALLLAVMQLPEPMAARLSWMLVGTGYANTVFYWVGMLATNRALTFGGNAHGPTSALSVVAFLPAFVFAFVTIVAMAMLASHCFGGDRGRVAVS